MFAIVKRESRKNIDSNIGRHEVQTKVSGSSSDSAFRTEVVTARQVRPNISAKKVLFRAPSDRWPQATTDDPISAAGLIPQPYVGESLSDNHHDCL